ncbi:phage tail tube protein [Paludisphaera rhizosphaerae]|uniref:phage tail tube protein n=1 Tax=Paludisphaera rhizosphaerae TaxID=2711216 RepID=UPI0013ECAEEF|nr:phage tail tube protein [Paludisphaera rhizosphaerae]
MANRYRCKGMSVSVDKLGTGVTYTKIPQVLSIGKPPKTVDAVEDTDLDSLAKEFSPGLTDNGELTIEMRFDPQDVTHQYLEDLADDPVITGFQIRIPTLPDATLYTFQGFPTNFDNPAGGNSDPLTANLNMKVTGVVTRTTEES